jgi:O-methyltransferase involved in polyketide biosynthesis
MYLDGELVKALVLELQSRFPGSEMVCEVVNKKWLSKPLKSIVNLKMQREMGLGKDTEYRFGISDSREMETWHAGIQFLDEWSYFDTGHPKLGWMMIFKGNKLMNTVQWTAHYKLN